MLVLLDLKHVYTMSFRPAWNPRATTHISAKDSIIHEKPDGNQKPGFFIDYT